MASSHAARRAMIHALHGNFGLPEDWEAVLTDVPGPHQSWHLWQTRRDWPEARRLEEWADRFTLAAASTSEKEQPVLAGYSLGGRLALHALTRHPNRWRAGVILSAHPGLRPASPGRTGVPPVPRGVPPRAALPASPSPAAERLSADALQSQFTSTLPWPEILHRWNEQPLLAGPLPRTQADDTWRAEIAAAFTDWSTGAQDDLLPALRAAAIPVLWLTGARDEKFTTLAQTAAASCPLVEHRSIENAGHRLLVDAPLSVAATITEFLTHLPLSR